MESHVIEKCTEFGKVKSSLLNSIDLLFLIFKSLCAEISLMVIPGPNSLLPLLDPPTHPQEKTRVVVL